MVCFSLGARPNKSKVPLANQDLVTEYGFRASGSSSSCLDTLTQVKLTSLFESQAAEALHPSMHELGCEEEGKTCNSSARDKVDTDTAARAECWFATWILSSHAM